MPTGVAEPKGAPATKRARGNPPAEAKDATIETVVTPIEAPPIAAPSIALPRIPTFDSESSAATPARRVLCEVVPWVVANLREYIRKHPELFNRASDLPLHNHEPLLIKSATEKDVKLKSYKAPWNANSAADALATTRMYEAAGNVCWVRLFPASKEMDTVAGGPMLWSQVTHLAQHFFSERAYSCRNAESLVFLPAPGVPHILFPTTMFVNAPKGTAIRSSPYFHASLDLISDHANLYAWWYAMFKALRDDTATLVASLSDSVDSQRLCTCDKAWISSTWPSSAARRASCTKHLRTW